MVMFLLKGLVFTTRNGNTLHLSVDAPARHDMMTKGLSLWLFIHFGLKVWATTKLDLMKKIITDRNAGLSHMKNVMQEVIIFSSLPKAWQKYVDKSVSLFLFHQFVLKETEKATVQKTIAEMFLTLTEDWLQKFKSAKQIRKHSDERAMSVEVHEETLSHPIGSWILESVRFGANIRVNWFLSVDKRLQLHVTVEYIYFPGFKILSCRHGHVTFLTAWMKTWGELYKFCGILSHSWLVLSFPQIRVFTWITKFYTHSSCVHYTLFDSNITDTSLFSKHNKVMGRDSNKDWIVGFHQKNVLALFYHVCVPKFLKATIFAIGGPPVLKYLVYDGPSVDSLSSTLAPWHKPTGKSEFLTSTFQCVIQVNVIRSSNPTNLPFFRIFGTPQSIQNISLKHPSNCNVSYPSNMCPMFRMCIINISTSWIHHIKISIQNFTFVGKIAVDCNYGGLSVYEWNKGSKQETLKDCQDTRYSANHKVLFSAQYFVVLVVFSYQTKISKFEVVVQAATTECEGIRINACGNIDEYTAQKLAVEVGNCLVVHVDYKWHEDVALCVTYVHYNGLNDVNKRVVYNVTGFLMTYLPKLNRSSKQSLLHGKYQQ